MLIAILFEWDLSWSDLKFMIEEEIINETENTTNKIDEFFQFEKIYLKQ